VTPPPPPKFTPCLWFDKNAEAAAKFYVSVFPNSKIDSVQKAPSDYPNGKKGDALVVDFTLAGQKFQALNGGPEFKFSEAISFSIDCEDQAEVDRMHKALSAVPQAEQCGWVKDKFGLSWQIVPRALTRLLADPDQKKAKRVFDAMMPMKKLDVAALERAAKGK
jgi:predicted 3-demethylubiquinone-9 3-methyltransferase (glyoxalase superfamily)